MVARSGGMEDGGWRMEDGGWRMEDRGWRMEDGGWRMEDGGWRIELNWRGPGQERSEAPAGHKRERRAILRDSEVEMIRAPLARFTTGASLRSSPGHPRASCDAP